MQNLYIFANARSIKQFYEKNYSDNFLPQAKSMAEFLDFILRVEGKVKIPPFLRSFYLFNAVCKSSDKAKRLGDFGNFEANFSKFLLNSTFFLKFYNEICAECVEISSIKGWDIYAFYDEHLSVLEEVFSNYQKFLAENSFFDNYFLENYKITFDLLSEFSKIVLYVEGFLSCFEMRILREISTKIPIIFKLDCGDFTKEYYEKLFGIPLEFGHLSVTLSNNSFNIDEVKSLNLDSAQKQVLSFKDRIAEVGAIFTQIDLWLEQGVKPEQISIILPDENFALYLKLFDEARNFNYAMGLKLKQTMLFKELKESKGFKDFSDFENFIENLDENTREQRAIKVKFKEALDEFNFAKKYLENLSTKELILVFLSTLEQSQIDDIGGGRIRVLGILETRGVDFSYVIIPEFNASNVPAISEKDIFLNTKIREKLNLPTRKNREDLQKYFYAQILKKAKEVCIFCVDNDESKPSRFLLDTAIFGDTTLKEANLKYSDYFLSGKALSFKDKQIIEPLDIEKIGSATSLQCFLTCKRKFYYQYVLGFKNPQSKTANLGSKLHEALKKAYEYAKEVKNFNADFLYELFCKHLEKAQDKREEFDIELAKKYVEKTLYEDQFHIMKDGWNPSEFEYEFKNINFEGFTFKKGIIDRIDKRGNDFYILDYKYKKNLKLESIKNIEKLTDFQLPIYALAVCEEFSNCKIENIRAGLYDIYEGKIIGEIYIKEKIEALKDKLQEIKENSKEMEFSLRDKQDICKYCDFIYLCNRY